MLDPVILTKIGLSKLFLWPEAERIQTYPEALAGLVEGRAYSKYEIATEIFRLIYVEERKGKAVREHQILNCFGMDASRPGKVAIRGINCLRQIGKDQYEATEEALRIGEAYRDRDEIAWATLLARQVARYEIRTRLILYLIGDGGWRLEFDRPDFFALPSINARLVRDGEMIALFQNQSKAFNRLLQENARISLGPWWKAELAQAGYLLADDFCFQGMREQAPPVNKLNSNIKPGLFLMKYLGVLQSHRGGWIVSGDKAVEVLGKAIANDFVTAGGLESQKSELSILRELVESSQDSERFVVVSQIARNWATQNRIPIYEAEEAFDRFVREQLYKGNLRVVERHQGQPRHGRGLFGDSGARKIKLELLG